jgi:hypothetical protein
MSTATGRTHRGYRHEGKKIPSVTEICKGLGWSQDRLIGWANKVGREQGITTWRASKPKMRIGTLAHDMIETYLIGAEPHHVLDDAEDPPAVKEGAQRAFDGFCTLWERELAPRTEILATECKMKFHLSGLWFGGTSDLVARVDGVPTIIDYKTGSGVHPEVAIQCAAYAYLWMHDGSKHTADAYGRPLTPAEQERRQANAQIAAFGVIHCPPDGPASYVPLGLDAHMLGLGVFLSLALAEAFRPQFNELDRMLGAYNKNRERSTPEPPKIAPF